MTIDTDRFRTLLVEERERVERAIASLRDEGVEEISTAPDNHLAETATVTLDREIDYTLEENSTRLLASVDGALKRVEDGTYGTCVTCGGDIAEARLEAYPWASHCIDCKRKLERA